MKTSTVMLLVLVSLTLSVIRFLIPSHALSLNGSYEAVAHLFVGGLMGAWIVSKEKTYLLLVGVLSLVELVAFFSKR